MKEIDFTDLDTKTLMQNLIIHHREADRYAKDKYLAKQKILASETFDEFKEAKRRFEIVQEAQSAVIKLRDAIYMELQTRRINIDNSITVRAFRALVSREKKEAILSKKVSRVTKEAKDIGIAVYKGDKAIERSEKNLWDAKRISYSGRRAGEARFVAKEPLKEFFTLYGTGVRG